MNNEKQTADSLDLVFMRVGHKYLCSILRHLIDYPPSVNDRVSTIDEAAARMQNFLEDAISHLSPSLRDSKIECWVPVSYSLPDHERYPKVTLSSEDNKEHTVRWQGSRRRTRVFAKKAISASTLNAKVTLFCTDPSPSRSFHIGKHITLVFS